MVSGSTNVESADCHCGGCCPCADGGQATCRRGFDRLQRAKALCGDGRRVRSPVAGRTSGCQCHATAEASACRLALRAASFGWVSWASGCRACRWDCQWESRAFPSCLLRDRYQPSSASCIYSGGSGTRSLPEIKRKSLVLIINNIYKQET